MTLNEIIVSALQQLKRGTDAQTIDTYRTAFTQYANMAVQDLAKSFPLFKTDEMILINGRFDVGELSRWCTKIVRVTQGDKEVDFSHDEETGLIKVNTDGDVKVRYRYVPLPLENTSDKPELPGQLHQCIVSYVVACDRGEGDPTTQGSASLYFQLYNEQKRGLMRGEYGVPESYKIKNMENW